jgi:hypothetical protein
MESVFSAFWCSARATAEQPEREMLMANKLISILLQFHFLNSIVGTLFSTLHIAEGK